MKLLQIFDLARQKSFDLFGTDDVYLTIDPFGIWTRPSDAVPWVLVVKREGLPVRDQRARKENDEPSRLLLGTAEQVALTQRMAEQGLVTLSDEPPRAYEPPMPRGSITQTLLTPDDKPFFSPGVDTLIGEHGYMPPRIFSPVPLCMVWFPDWGDNVRKEERLSDSLREWLVSLPPSVSLITRWQVELRGQEGELAGAIAGADTRSLPMLGQWMQTSDMPKMARAIIATLSGKMPDSMLLSATDEHDKALGVFVWRVTPETK